MLAEKLIEGRERPKNKRVFHVPLADTKEEIR